MEESGSGTPETHDCVIKLRLNPQRRKDRVVIGCGAGFGGDRPIAALKLLQRVKELDYLVLECLAERTLAERYTAMKFGGKGYDPRRLDNQLKYVDGDVSVYLGAAPIVECLERYTPDVIITSRVADASLFLGPMDCGWKGWGEISYGGYESVQRAKAAEFLVRAWMDESYPGISNHIISYIIGLDSVKATCISEIMLKPSEDVRLRMDGLFEKEEHAVQFTKEFTALYTNGPAGGGGISTGCKKEIFLEKGLVGREYVSWQISVARNNIISPADKSASHLVTKQNYAWLESDSTPVPRETVYSASQESIAQETRLSAALAGQRIPLYDVAHSRAGDKGNDLNFSIIPHYPPDIERLKTIVTPEWVKEVLSPLLNPSSFPGSKDIERRDKCVNQHVKVEIYEVKGINSLNVVVRNILDGGVNCSRRIDRHGKTISDVVLCQKVVLPP
ncbi:UNVERIFIED_CONTAM: hypothetical protein Sradi_5864800 [Sesamum radiatum]|uniref:Uncharacterized protein n=1 Tax=Sesamum radiatum TaxID=300843 RepID=A0AAW2KQK9_SESRA